MPVSKNLKNSRRSKTGATAALPVIACFLASAAVMAVAVTYFQKTGATLYWGDAESHLDIARRVIDSRTPGWAQLGTTWLPLPHLLMLPLVRNDWLWKTGLAGAIVSAFCMALAATFLFAAVRRLFGSSLSASTAAAVFLLNPNTLYLGSIPMTEAVFFASLFALLCCSARFAETGGWASLIGAAVAACAGALTRYEAWFLMPFFAAYILFTGGARRWWAAAWFCVIAGAAPLLWLCHNWWYFGDPLYFYRGPWSALAIQGDLPYPGKGNWRLAARYFLEAGKWIAGWPALAAGAAGVIAAAVHKVFWPLFLLALLPVFYIWSIHSKGVPIFVPDLEPHSWYNTRYAMAFLPLIALGAGALARFGRIPALAVVAFAFAPLLLHPGEHSITWQEAEINSRGRRAWTEQAVSFLRGAAGPNESYFTGYGLTSIYRTLGIPLKDTLSGDNDVQYAMVWSRPDLFLREAWAIVTGGDDVQSIIDKARLHGPRYELSERITVKGQPVVEIYHRVYENPLR
jgi:4-amino-4-deoxy-L-arabinose transferase-like glycosyltransferase